MNKNDNYSRTNLSTLLFDKSLHFIVRTSLQASSPLNKYCEKCRATGKKVV